MLWMTWWICLSTKVSVNLLGMKIFIIKLLHCLKNLVYRRSYRRSFGQFVDFCHDQEVDPYAASPNLVARYLMQRYQTCGLSRLYVHLSAISHFYRSKGLDSPCDNSRVKMMMRGIKRQESLDVPVRRVKPLTVQILSEALTLLTDDSLVTWRTVWRMHITFFCFLRFDDLKRLKVISQMLSACHYLMF